MGIEWRIEWRIESGTCCSVPRRAASHLVVLTRRLEGGDETSGEVHGSVDSLARRRLSKKEVIFTRSGSAG